MTNSNSLVVEKSQQVLDLTAPQQPEFQASNSLPINNNVASTPGGNSELEVRRTPEDKLLLISKAVGKLTKKLDTNLLAQFKATEPYGQLCRIFGESTRLGKLQGEYVNRLMQDPKSVAAPPPLNAESNLHSMKLALPPSSVAVGEEQPVLSSFEEYFIQNTQEAALVIANNEGKVFEKSTEGQTQMTSSSQENTNEEQQPDPTQVSLGEEARDSISNPNSTKDDKSTQPIKPDLSSFASVASERNLSPSQSVTTDLAEMKHAYYRVWVPLLASLGVYHANYGRTLDLMLTAMGSSAPDSLRLAVQFKKLTEEIHGI